MKTLLGEPGVARSRKLPKRLQWAILLGDIWAIELGFMSRKYKDLLGTVRHQILVRLVKARSLLTLASSLSAQQARISDPKIEVIEVQRPS